MRILGELPRELTRLAHENRVAHNGWHGLPAEVDPEDDCVALGADGGPRRVEPAPSTQEISERWIRRYPTYASVDPLVALLPALRERLLLAASKLPAHYDRSKLSAAELRDLRERTAPVRRASSLLANVVHGIERLRHNIAFRTGEADPNPFDAYAFGGSIIKDPRYQPYSRTLGKLSRSKPKVKEKRREYDATPERKAARSEWKRSRREDPAFREAENAKKRARYALRRELARVLETV